MSDTVGDERQETAEPARLERRLQRAEAARREAEAIAEDATRRLYDLVQELESTNHELRRVNDDLEAFVYSTSHDMKTPLVTVIGYLDVLKLELADTLTEEQADILERVRSQAGYMRDLVRDLLELSRVGRVSTAVDHVPTTAVVRELAGDRTRRHDGLRIDIGDLPDLRINAVRCRQLFANLLDNAIAHSGSAAVHITVSARDLEDGALEFSVADDGRGIAPDDLERVFAPFERRGADDDFESHAVGTTGLGLTICRKIVRSYGGEIWAEGVASGADIRFRLPASARA